MACEIFRKRLKYSPYPHPAGLMRQRLAAPFLGFLIACSSAAPRAESWPDLVPSLEVEVARDTVNFVLHLTNSGTQPLVLEFNSSQRYDFQVRTPAGDAVWTWSADKVFGQMVGSETIASGDSREFRDHWAAGGRKGAFVAVGRIVAGNRPVEQRTNFEIR